MRFFADDEPYGRGARAGLRFSLRIHQLKKIAGSQRNLDRFDEVSRLKPGADAVFVFGLREGPDGEESY
jgi:hypothetical protein